ncbi:MAG: complex I NDUFA9 subunit family protein [Gammaproteobacteria bacterium]|nr:complex I NDUFA9 subunit family protein [Gammaproteobacteria bacterium]MDE2263889.1 complex I NDUFA9 subunit family protein [Gammaproteobacteria bacterium]
MPAALNICVLGGTGFVGTELVTRLVNKGHWVRIPTRSPAHGQHLRVLSTVELVTANVHDSRTLGQLLAGMDAVINLVGILNESGSATFQSAHTDLAAKLVAAARGARIRRLLQMSAVGADREHGPSRYLRSKGEAEALIRGAAAHLDFTIFRPSVIFGPRDSLTNRFAALLRLPGGFLPLARPRARFAPVYVGDVADAFVRALEGRGSFDETYELCGPDVLTLEQLVRMTAAVAQLPCRILGLPDALGRLQAALLGLLPGKPFSLDNFRSLTLDSVCTQNGLARLGIAPRHMAAVLPFYLGPFLGPTELDAARKNND